MAKATCSHGEEDVRSKSAEDCECESESEADPAAEVERVGLCGSVSFKLEELGFTYFVLVHSCTCALT